MEAFNLCSLRDIQIDSTITQFIYKEIHLKTVTNENWNTILTDYIVNQIGELSSRQFLNCPFFCVSYDIESNDALGDIGRVFKSRLDHLISNLWFSKDGSANLCDVVSYIPGSTTMFVQRLGAGLSNSKGSFEVNTYNIEDFNLAARVCQISEKLQTDSSAAKQMLPKSEISAHPKVYDSVYHYKDQSEPNRIERCLSMLKMSRSNSFLPLKISLGISVLECLFTTDSGEITHKIAERTALYLEDNSDMKMTSYSLIKTCYGIRSKFFHGQKITKGKREFLQETSQKLDTLLRRILLKVLFEDSKYFLSSEKDLEHYFQKLIFSK